MRLLSTLDHDHNNKVSLLEFAQQMGKYLDKGQVEIPKEEQFNAEIVSKEMQKELIEEAK